jgi:hypothetical protein
MKTISKETFKEFFYDEASNNRYEKLLKNYLLAELTENNYKYFKNICKVYKKYKNEFGFKSFKSFINIFYKDLISSGLMITFIAIFKDDEFNLKILKRGNFKLAIFNPYEYSVCFLFLDNEFIALKNTVKNIETFNEYLKIFISNPEVLFKTKDSKTQKFILKSCIN